MRVAARVLSSGANGGGVPLLTVAVAEELSAQALSFLMVEGVTKVGFGDAQFILDAGDIRAQGFKVRILWGDAEVAEVGRRQAASHSGTPAGDEEAGV